ncbi:hypothetical protein SELMODRAFT_432210 [Selaginella moellendorffii]|uniref:LIMR family protein SELMODRAFT_432210 n=1 Tax=Selaginella moellendorffii TaxID=88036 RepID=LMBD1_SELML|nr:RecName: Full=LIMR family protein SELMODRAFT_432210 [Selaginella moellendorffii]EFJ04658.1 hypothetical protein SELMODRAFT_432210 [Selaginella moellendorffii]
MLPADAVNRHSCEKNLYVGVCKLTLPMKQLWWVVYIIDTVLVYLVIPFRDLLLRERPGEDCDTKGKERPLVGGDTPHSLLPPLGNSLSYADFTVKRPGRWRSPMILAHSMQRLRACFSLSSNVTLMLIRLDLWLKLRGLCVFPTYVIALSILFTMFGGVRIATLPLSLIFAFKNRPKCVMALQEATDLAKSSNVLKKVTLGLQREERGGKKGRKLRKNVKKVQQEDTSWALTVLFYLAKLVFGILGLALSIIWLLHILVFMLVNPPAFPFLNQVFIQLDSAGDLLGTTPFAIFCYYFVMSVISGEMHLGMKLLFLSIHPMK